MVVMFRDGGDFGPGLTPASDDGVRNMPLSLLWYRVLCEDAILKAVLSPQDRGGHQQFRTSIVPSIYNLGRAWLLVNNTRPLEGSVPISHVLILVQLLWLESCRMMTGQAWFMHPPLGLGGRPVPPGHMDQEGWVWRVMSQSNTEHRKTYAPSRDQSHDHHGKQAQDGEIWRPGWLK